MKFLKMNEIIVLCKHCGKDTVYRIKGDKVANIPRPTCMHCKERFREPRKKIHELIQGSRKTDPFDQKLTLWIMQKLQEGLYGAQLIQKTSESKDKIYKIINWLFNKKYISLDCIYPKIYKVILDGELYMVSLAKQLKTSKKKKSKKPITINKMRVHNIVFKNELISEPHCLYSIPKDGKKTTQEKYGGHKHPFRIDIYRRDKKLKNVVYFDIKPPVSMFDYLTNISVFTDIIKYRFKFPEEFQWIPFTREAYDNYLEQRRTSCKAAREWLKIKGFEINKADPILSQVPSCAIDLNGKLALGTMFRGSIRLENGDKIEFDDSMGRGDGELEANFDLLDKTFIETPEKVDKLEDDIEQIKNDYKTLPNTISQIIKYDLTSFKVDFARELTSQLSKAVGKSVSSALKDVFINNQTPVNENNRGENPFTI